MLNSITIPENYLECIKAVKKSFWPYEEDVEFKNDFKTALGKGEAQGGPISTYNWNNISITQQIQKFIDKTTKNAIENYCNTNSTYVLLNNNISNSKLHIPFIEKYHNLFSKRQWNEPYLKPTSFINDLIRLEPIQINSQKVICPNYSSNGGNYNHFINVVAAASHLIHFFTNINLLTESDLFKHEWEVIQFDKTPSDRKFKLLLSAYYHDIGKTIVDHRHAMEGFIILSSYQSHILREFEILSKANGYSFNREDLLFVADLVYYHDLYGTLSTGENGYIRLINLIERIERYTRKDSNKVDEQNKQKTILTRGKQHLFDLWLLNVADILVSVKDKWKLQDLWVNKNLTDHAPSGAIKNFFAPPKGKQDNQRIDENYLDQGYDLLHDLKITFDLYDVYLNDQFNKQGQDFKVAAQKCSHYHDIARMRRLIKNSLFPSVNEKLKGLLSQNGNIDPIVSDLSIFLNSIITIDRYTLDKTIETAVKSATEYTEFCRRLSWVGQLDYSLGFFREIAQAALLAVTKQLKDLLSTEKRVVAHTGWINDKIEDYIKDRPDWCRINARYFIDNYTGTVVNILNYLLFRDQFFDRILNFEFEDAKQRLTEDKINRILMFEGPSRSTKSAMLILETVFIY